MILSNVKMVEGSPLQYYWPQRRDSFQFFRPFETVSGTMDRPEELMMPSSPASTQSDSDNSVSSVEISPSQIRLSNSIMKSEVQCRWRNCGIHFSTLDQLATHVAKVHSASGLGGLFYCGWDGCPRNDKGFNARYKMLVHVRTHTNEKPHKCPTCSKSFSRAENLKIHSRSHSGEKPYVCPVPGCNKAYSNSSDRFKHTRTHQVEKPYHCKVPGCPKKYTDPSSLRKHVKTYKHFANEIEEKANESPSPEAGEEPNGRTNCDGLCCVSSRGRLPLQFGGFLDLKADESRSFRFVGYSTFQGCEQPMDLDTPLDLSMHRRNF